MNKAWLNLPMAGVVQVKPRGIPALRVAVMQLDHVAHPQVELPLRLLLRPPRVRGEAPLALGPLLRLAERNRCKTACTVYSTVSMVWTDLLQSLLCTFGFFGIHQLCQLVLKSCAIAWSATDAAVTRQRLLALLSLLVVLLSPYCFNCTLCKSRCGLLVQYM